ncbi:phosphatidylinositol-glycan biosynthesis class S protein-domain-containing protein [Zopfochytrium polystomum]|nr:phosphatidylinositol-glycan biosynthesis class S protein-domain-containing protein [Zopfochytrium polystomum]
MARSAAPQRHSAAPAPAPTTLILTARQAILASVWTVLLLALPMWWKTTEIHRAPIPSERIRQWEAFIQNTIDHDRMRRMKFAPEYLLTLSLFNADPETLLVDWDIAPAVRAYLNPFLDALSVLYNFTVSSQVQHYATLAIKPEKAVGHEGEYYYLRPKDLPLFINSAEWNFGASAVSTSPPMNFIVYVPQASQSPLYVVGSDATNGFLIPQWGGIVIANPTRPVDTIGGRFHFDVDELRPAFEVFVAQLRGLLGVEAVSIPAPERLLPGYAVTYGQSGTGVTGWEVDRVVRRSVAHNVRDAVGAMASLATLIEKMENMVVLDHISDELTTALDALDGARAALSASPDRGREPLDLAAVARTARNAAVAAERAFFDPTMVSLLYFPTEHKYAVYMPLFTPILGEEACSPWALFVRFS